jgi:lipid A 3-O-deacylase
MEKWGGDVYLHRLVWIFVILQVLLLFSINTVYGHETAEEDSDSEQISTQNDFGFELEYYTPVRSKRQIDTTALNIYFSKKQTRIEKLSLIKGITLTYGEGYIDRYNKVRNCEAVGIGPVFKLKYEPYRWEKLSLAFDGSGALIFYNENFPVGGDFYNFMWRIGPTLTYKFNENTSFSLSYKLMHVSNGQNARNPAYDAEGISLSVNVLF